jgi:hypothetical protein
VLLTAFQLLSHPFVFVLLLQNPGPILLVPMFHGLGTLGELTPRLRAGGSVSIARVLLRLTCYQPTDKGVPKDPFELVVRIPLQNVGTRKEL